MVSATAAPNFITPAQAADEHYWLQTDTVYEPTADGSSNSGIGHSTAFGARGSYEHPYRPGEYRHEFTFGAQATTENNGDARKTIDQQEYKVQANHSSISNIFAGTGDGDGIHPRDAENWDWGPVAKEIADAAANEVDKWVGRASSAYSILEAAVKASPTTTSESGPGWVDSESYSWYNRVDEIGQNSGFIVDVSNSDWVTMDCDSKVSTASMYYANTHTGFSVTMSNESASAYSHNSAYSTTSTDGTNGWTDTEIDRMRAEMGSDFTLAEKHPEEYPQHVVDDLGIEKINPEDAERRAVELRLSEQTRELWADVDDPIYFMHNPPVLIVPKNSPPSI